MSSGILKWYGSPIITLLRLVGSKQMPNFRSLLSTKTKLFMQGVASFTGFNTPTCSVLSISYLKFSLRWTGIGQQGVCLCGMLGSSWILYGGPGNLPVPSNTSGESVRICSLLVINLLTSCFLALVVTRVWVDTACSLLWVATCWELCTDNLVDHVFFGWSWELVI